MPDKEPKGKASVTIESAPGLPDIKGEPKKKEKLRMPPVPDVTKTNGPKLIRTKARVGRRRSSRQRA